MDVSVVDSKERRKVAGALIEYDSEKGVPVFIISAATGLSEPEAEEAAALLERHAEAERLLPLSDRKWIITDYGRKAYRDDRFASKMRKCLQCQEMFDSSHAGNRLCEKCSASEYSSAERSDAT